MQLDDIIKNYRKENRITQQELADRCNLSKAYISMLENKFKAQGRKKDITPSIQAIKKLSNGTGLKFDDLLEAIDGNVSLVQIKEEIELDEREKGLILNYRKLSDTNKEIIDSTIKIMNQRK